MKASFFSQIQQKEKEKHKQNLYLYISHQISRTQRPGELKNSQTVGLERWPSD